MSRDLTGREIFQVSLTALLSINLFLLGYDVYLNRQVIARNNLYALDWNSNERAILEGVTASLEDKTVDANPWMNEGIYERNHDLWEKGWFTVFTHRENKARRGE